MLGVASQTVCYTRGNGAWRSPVAHRYGVPVVGGSNPLAPTTLTWRHVAHAVILSSSEYAK